MTLRRLLYSVFLYLVLPIVLLKLFIRSRLNPDYRKRWSERLALTMGDKSHQNSDYVICIHAVSVGEIIAARPLIESLFENYPECKILVTTTTPTGSDRVQSMFSEQLKSQQLIHVYLPYDLPGAVRRFIHFYQPKILIIVETEIWPNLYARCYQKNIPILMVNARLSEKSLNSYLKIKGLVRETISKVNTIAVRSEIDSERFLQLGAKVNQIKQIGNIKYDIKIDIEQQLIAKKSLNKLNEGRSSRRQVLVVASTHEGEDSSILLIYLNLIKNHPNLLCVLIPRHPERFEAVYQQCVLQISDELHVKKRSEFDQIPSIFSNSVDIVIGDSMGEMQVWYAMADVVFVGGSLVNTGGHNPLEATVYGVPVVSGPHMFNFEDVSTSLSKSDLLYICNDELCIAKKLDYLLDQTITSNVYLEDSQSFLQQHKGVTARLLDCVKALLSF